MNHPTFTRCLPARMRRSAATLAAVVSAVSLLATAQIALAATPSKAQATALARNSKRCRQLTSLDACYDAIRWEPSNPALLIALGDVLQRAHRLPEAVKAYRRAAVLTPKNPAIAAKIRAAENAMTARRKPLKHSTAVVAVEKEPSKHFSNDDPVAQSH